MGIRGLESYLERYNPDACYEVNIVELIHKYRRENKRPPVIVVDGMGVMRFFYKSKDLSWICGGQLKEYEQIVKDFIKTFQKEGAELVFFFDGPHTYTKREIWIKRRLETLKKVNNLFDDLSNGVRVSLLEHRELYMNPSNLRFLTSLVAKHCGCKVYRSIRECDLEIAEYAFHHKCMAILAQDTDFVIFKSAKYYLSMKNFNFRYMTTLNYDGDKLASSVGLYSTELPLLASLLGNDIISNEDLKPFHRYIVNKNGGRYQKNNDWIQFRELIVATAQFIKQHVHQSKVNCQILQKIAQRVFLDKSKWLLLEQSILSYDFSAKANKSSGPPTSSDENWKNILRKGYELHCVSSVSSTIYSIVAQKFYSCGNGLEDYRLNDLPPAQIILKPLREKLYGILHFENPEVCEIEELVLCGFHSLDEAAFTKLKKPNVEHPGLLALWSRQSLAHPVIIGDMFNIDPLKVKSFPGNLLVPALALRYLYNKVKFLAWELYALVSSAVLVQFYMIQELARLPIPERIQNTRSIRVYSLVTRSYSTVIFILNGIGDPVPSQMILPSNYSDGKLFQMKYLQASQNLRVIELCDGKSDAVKGFERMMSFITENNQPPI